MSTGQTAYEEQDEEPGGLSLGDLVSVLRAHFLALVVLPLAAGAGSLGVTWLIAPTFTASTTFLPPQQAQSSAASALAALGPLAGLAGSVAGVRSSAEQYVSLMQSVTVADRIIEQFDLMSLYEVKFLAQARLELAGSVRFAIGKKDGLITVHVDEKDPQRAADIANRYVDELRRMTSLLAVTEAQQRRVFFDRQLQQSRDRLVQAQQALQSSGFNSGALKAEPRAAADAYARLKATVTAAQIRLQSLRTTLADSTPEVLLQLALLDSLRAQLASAERASDNQGGPDYIGKYREFKYQETLFELYARQFELARADESREGALIQVVDPATPPELKSKPRRASIAIMTSLVSGGLLFAALLLRHVRRMRRASVT